MTKKNFDKKFCELLKGINKDLKDRSRSLFYSGGVASSNYSDDTCELLKIILKVALEDVAAHMGMTDNMEKAVRNLRHF